MNTTLSSTTKPAVGARRRWTVFVIGILVLGSGVVLTILAGIGVGSWQILETGLAQTTGASLGLVIFVESVVAVVLAWLLFRQPPGIGTLIIVVTIGPLIGVMVDVLPSPTTWFTSVLMLAVGIAFIGVGIGLYVPTEIGASAQDLLFVGLYRRFDMRPGVARFIVDATLVTVGWLLGGQLGVGTVILTVLLPPIVDWSLGLGRRLMGAPDSWG